MINKTRIILLCVFAPLASKTPDPVRATIQSHDNVIIQFMRPSCPYSAYLNPLFKQIQKSADQKGIHSLLVDITGKDFYKKEYGFSTVPTVIYFRKGKEVFRHGSNDKRFGIADFKRAIAQSYGIKL